MLTKVIVIGGGLSGLSAAHTVIEHGGRVLLLDKNPFCGGNSTKATSGINAALTKTQILKGVKDTVSEFERDTARSANLGKSEQTYPLAKVLTGESDPAVEWLINSFGLDLSLVSRLGGHSHPRTHRGKERFPGMTITYALLEKLEEIEKNTKGEVAKIITKAKATNLIRDEKNNVIGVEYEKDGKIFKEHGVVVLASGGFAADFTQNSLLQKYRPDICHLPTTNGNHCTGDGIKMATSVGGELVDMEWVQVHPTGLVHPDDPNAKVKFLAAEALRGVGGILLNQNGERFCDELGRRDYVTGEMNKNKGPFRLVLNGKAGKEIEWHCKHYIGRKLMKRYENGKDLAKDIGISVEKLAQTFAAYNENAVKGTDQYGKKFFTNAPFDINDHFYVSFVTPVVHYCMGGVKISTNGEVMGKENIVPGLYAAGEVTGGVHGKNRLGGNSLIECVVFGRVAGRNASKYLLRSSISHLQNIKASKTSNRVVQIRNHLQTSKFGSDDCCNSIYTKVYDVKYSNAFKKNSTVNPDIIKLEPSSVPSKISGGTAHILPEERKNASFNVSELTDFLNGGKEMTKRRKFIESPVDKNPELFHSIYNMSREEHLKHGVKDFIRIHKPYKDFKPTREDIAMMSDVAIGFGGLNNSHSIFMSTLVGQGSDEQVRFWLPKVLNFEITGSYAQTELGHGSNVRGLSTTAEYDSKTEEFVLNTPTLTSMKWWPGCLGKIATHVTLFAQLILDGKEYGLHIFFLQIRDENHLPLQGIRLGDLGNKVGDNNNDTGFMILDNVRIPRENMLMKYRKVTKDGKYEKVGKEDSKTFYTTMVTTRASMVSTAAARLCQSATIAIRYSAVRKQGFVSNKSDVSYTSQERKIVDHRIQQYRLFKQLAIGYGLKFTTKWMLEQVAAMEGKNVGIIKNTDVLKELSASSAGLKSLATWISTNGVEDLRKCCGGNGYLLNSGIAALACDYLWQITAEGDFIILALLTARHLIKSIGKVIGGGKVIGVLDYFNVIGEPEFDLAKHKPSPAKNASEFLNPTYLLSLFRYKSLERNINVARDFNELIAEKGLTFEEAWNACTNDLLRASHSHCYYIIMQNYVQKIKEPSSKNIQKVLHRLCVLFALSNFLDENWGDILSTDQFRLIKSSINPILSEIRPDCVPLVDAFAYHDYVLKSSIGRADGNVYEALFDAAQKSVLNEKDPWDGYEKELKPHLNKELLKRGNKPIITAKL